jgi:hypothetical protein
MQQTNRPGVQRSRSFVNVNLLMEQPLLCFACSDLFSHVICLGRYSWCYTCSTDVNKPAVQYRHTHYTVYHQLPRLIALVCCVLTRQLPTTAAPHLQHCWAYLEAWAVQQLLQLGAAEVADPNAAREVGINARLQRAPRLSSAGGEGGANAAGDRPAISWQRYRGLHLHMLYCQHDEMCPSWASYPPKKALLVPLRRWLHTGRNDAYDH